MIKDTPIARGQILITPAEGVDVDGGKSFQLIGFTITFGPFTLSASCLGFGGSRTYNTVSVQLGKSR